MSKSVEIGFIWISFFSFTLLEIVPPLLHTEAMELVRDKFGFELASGVTEAKLDPEAEHYYLEIRPIASD